MTERYWLEIKPVLLRKFQAERQADVLRNRQGAKKARRYRLRLTYQVSMSTCVLLCHLSRGTRLSQLMIWQYNRDRVWWWMSNISNRIRSSCSHWCISVTADHCYARDRSDGYIMKLYRRASPPLTQTQRQAMDRPNALHIRSRVAGCCTSGSRRGKKGDWCWYTKLRASKRPSNERGGRNHGMEGEIKIIPCNSKSKIYNVLVSFRGSTCGLRLRHHFGGDVFIYKKNNCQAKN